MASSPSVSPLTLSPVGSPEKAGNETKTKLKKGTPEYNDYIKTYSKNYYHENKKYTHLTKIKHDLKASVKYILEINTGKEITKEMEDKINELTKMF